MHSQMQAAVIIFETQKQRPKKASLNFLKIYCLLMGVSQLQEKQIVLFVMLERIQ